MLVFKALNGLKLSDLSELLIVLNRAQRSTNQLLLEVLRLFKSKLKTYIYLGRLLAPSSTITFFKYPFKIFLIYYFRFCFYCCVFFYILNDLIILDIISCKALRFT